MSDDGWDSGPDDAPVQAPQQQQKQYGSRSFTNSRSNDYRNDHRSNDFQRQGGNNRGSSDYAQRSDNRGGNNSRYNNDGGNEAGTMEIFPQNVGMVIGRGGAKIREIQEKFAVNVKVDREPNQDGMSSVTIRGAQDSVDKAKKYIEDLINDGKSIFDRPFVPIEPKSEPEFQLIDWQGAAQKSDAELKKKWESLPKLIKNFYKEHESVSKMDEEMVAVFREANNKIVVTRAFMDKPLADVKIPNPVSRFEHCFSEYPDLMNEIRKQGFEKPSPIQSQAWPVLLKGEDMIGIAQTGTGKTLAFLLPAMIHTEYQPVARGAARGGPNVLVMAPTRELALQIEKEVGKYQFRGIKAVCVYGGGDRRQQINSVGKGVEIVIATPGRLNDLIQAKALEVESVTYLVLDEADRMLDLGFEPQIRKVLLNIRPDRQTVMTSATWPPGVRRLAERYMINPIQVCVGSLDLAAVHSVQQIIEIMDEEDKFYRIMDFVKNMQQGEKVIIFCGKKARADDLSSEISLSGIPVQCIHGDRDQSDREQALEDIKKGEVSILIATDVASRGIDIEDISHVINYDFPRNIEEYVHRVGRTGRAGRTGISMSFVTREDWSTASELIDILEEANQEVPDQLREMKDRFSKMKERREKEKTMFGGGGGGGRGRGGGGGRGRGGGGGRRY